MENALLVLASLHPLLPLTPQHPQPAPAPFERGLRSLCHSGVSRGKSCAPAGAGAGQRPIPCSPPTAHSPAHGMGGARLHIPDAQQLLLWLTGSAQTPSSWGSPNTGECLWKGTSGQNPAPPPWGQAAQTDNSLTSGLKTSPGEPGKAEPREV